MHVGYFDKMDIPYPVLAEIGLYLESQHIVGLRLVNRHWNDILTPLAFCNLAFTFPLNPHDHNKLQKYGKYSKAPTRECTYQPILRRPI
ncbi:hypothetical protein DSO57_1022947 [Entomophthora muscae]|uniref:Uncharacterized protein n=1 Tax=Entomophthora muscae TaxID=34485 RepID=A0ACC2RHR8_9FUNG|nr:hypothetical protein DSO57_1022947 [Entomophthora muscae]